MDAQHTTASAAPASSAEVERARRLERGLAIVRALGAMLGLFLVSQSNAGPPPHASHRVLLLGYGLILALAAGDLLIFAMTTILRTPGGLRILGALAFAFDATIIFVLAWAYSYDPKGFVWVIVYVLPLEGAIRYQVSGAAISVVATALSETLREAYVAHRFSGQYQFLASDVLLRVGVQALIGLVAGLMARSLARQADNATLQAHHAEEAARRETEARRELAAFNTALLTGVAAEDLDTSIRLMAETIGTDLGFETFAILLREGPDLVVKGMHGLPFYEDRVPIGRGVTGTVAASGTPLVVPEVRAFDGYICVDPEMRSEMAAPMRIGEEVIGVLDVESRTPAAFDAGELELLTRLADQIALVAHSNRLLSEQRDMMARLQELDQMKSDFVAITSHELRTPITAIRGFVKTALRNADRLAPGQLTDFMTIIDRQSARLARLVEDLLFVSRIEAGTIRFDNEAVDLELLLYTMVEQLGPEGAARIHRSVEPSGATVYTDPHRLEQIVRNLVENALKFSPSEARVDVEAVVRDDWYQVVVLDRGVGITPEDLPRIFDRFHQVGQAMTREAEGAGLGLYITKRLVEAMGGTITLTSTPGEGTRFRVWLPVAPSSPTGRTDGDGTSRPVA